MTPTAAADFHSHLMPGVDDGAADLTEARLGVEAMARDGVTALVTTPHFDGSLTLHPSAGAERLAAFDAAWSALTGDAGVRATSVTLMRGVELLLDVPDPDLRDPRLRLNGGRFVLVEFPAMQLPPAHVDFAVRTLRDTGWQPVIAHPERYRNVDDALTLLGTLRMAGAYLQVNAGSFVGAYGAAVARRAWTLLERGWLDFGSSDYHARGTPAVTTAVAMLHERGAAEQAALLFNENPRRLFDDQSPRPVPPWMRTRTPAWSRWWSRLRGRA